VILAGVLAPRAVLALDPHRRLDQYLHSHWGAEEGYTGGSVSAIAQTPDGYLWLGADNGLVRFDGLAFRVFNQTNTPAFSGTAVMKLVTDSEGSLWILLQNRDLLRYRNGVFEPMLDRVNTFAHGLQHDLLIARPALWMWSEAGKLVEIHPVPDHSGRLAITMAENPDGTMWVGTRDSELYGIRGGRTFEVRGLPDRKVNCLLSAEGGVEWVGTDRGLSQWTGSEISQQHTPPALRSAQILALARDHDANIWVGTAHGVARMTPQGDAEESAGTQDEAEAATALFEDREGNLWVGGPSGLERFRDSGFLTFSPTVGTATSGPIYTDPAGRTWTGPSSGGLLWFRGEQRNRLTLDGLSQDVVYSIAGGPGEIWVGRQHGGLTHLREIGGAWSAETFTAANGLASGPIYALHRSRDGTVWAGSLNGGVSRIANGRVTTYTAGNGLASNAISAIEEGADGAMWFATANGLNVFAHDRWQLYTSAQGLPPTRINCLTADSAGVLWIGTDVGLAFLRNGHVQLPRDSPEGMLDDVLGIADDGRGSLWVATPRRVLRVARDRLLSDGVVSLREFGPADGIPAPEGVRRDRPVVRDADGRIWFSLRRGISVVEPARVSGETPPALVHIESVAADGNPLDPGMPWKIPPNRVRIRFDFLALSLAAPERVKYRYRLDNLDHEWSEPVPARDTVYMNLDPGPYRFRVIACNSEGIWNSREAAIALEVEPAIWQRNSFRALMLALCALAGASFYRMRLGRLTKELNIGFQERLDERTRIAQELHDTLLQSLLATSMQLHVAVSRLPEEFPGRPQFARVLSMLQQVVGESRNAVRGLRAPSKGADDLEQAFSRVREELAVRDSIEVRVLSTGPRRPLNPLIRDQIYRIGREAISNALRHSGASVVEVELDYDDSRLWLQVRDTGCGIDEKVLRVGKEGHWGLIGMRECAEKIGGRLKLTSRLGAGTQLELTIPGHIAFLKTSSARQRRWLPGWVRKRTTIGAGS
jgi:signal transduction histidine kinase/ligand-binding sensor domain-containing protein